MSIYSFAKMMGGNSSQLAKNAFVCAAICAAFLFAPGIADAETILWYRFDGTGTTIENKANPGVMDGTLKGLATWGSSYSFDDNEDKLPTRSNLPDGWVKTIDPKSDQSFDSAKGLSFRGTGDTGVVYVPRSELTDKFKSMTNFTYEAFFKIPSAAIGRSNAMYPIFHWGKDQDEGVMVAMYCNAGKFYPYIRYEWAKSDGTFGNVRWGNTSSTKLAVTPDEWHHIAFTYACNLDTGVWSDRVYVDYNELEANNGTGRYGIYLDPSSSNPFLLGVCQFNNGRSYWGEIAEARISDVVLNVRDFLRPIPSSPVDDDTLVYLPLGDTLWFATNTLFSGKMNAPLNGAPTAQCNPVWEVPSSFDVFPKVVNDVIGTALRPGCFSTDVHLDSNSVSFSQEVYEQDDSQKIRGHVLRMPHPTSCNIAEGDFTIECFFKTDGQVQTEKGWGYSFGILITDFVKILVDVQDGKLKSFLGDPDVAYSTLQSTSRVDDSQWHHLALVYNSAISNSCLYLDYKAVASASQATNPLKTSTSTFIFGTSTSYNQRIFNGWFDDFRVTKRALNLHEFLTTRPLVSATDLMFARFEGDMTSGQDAVYVANGETKTYIGNEDTDPVFVNIKNLIDLDNDGIADVMSMKALSLGGDDYLVFQNSSAFEYSDMTLEFFAKIDSMKSYANLVRALPGLHMPWGPAWAVYFSGTVDDEPTFNLRMNCGTNCVSPHIQTTLTANPGIKVADGKWHHWAVTIDRVIEDTNTVMTLYRDYRQVAQGTFDYYMALRPEYGASLSFGCNGVENTQGPIQGCFDEIRLRPGVQPVSSFMRRVPYMGMMLIVR